MDAYIWSWAPGVAGQDRYEKVAAALARSLDGAWTLGSRPAHRPRSGASRRWLRLSSQGATLWFDGHVLVANGDVSGGVAEVVHGTPWLSTVPVRPLGRIGGPFEDALDALSVWTTAMVLLDRLAETVTGRPDATMAEVDRCAEWLASPIRQHLMGRGVRERVLAPWRAYVSGVRQQLLAIGEYWSTTVPEARSSAPAPVDGLLDPLTRLNTSRDEALILAEYEDRLERLERETGRAAAEVGMLGTFATLALVPFEATLGPAYLVPVVLAGAIYYGGYALSRLGRARERRMADVGSDAPHDIDAVVRRLLRRPAAVLVGDRIGAAEFAAAAQLWLRLLQHHELDPGAESVTFGTDPAALGDRAGVVLGGPLVQPRHRLELRAACDLVGSGTYSDWRFEAEGERLIGAAGDETAAVVSTALDREDVLLAVGFRDTGAVGAARWLGRSLSEPDELPAAPWTLLRRDARAGFEPASSGTRETS